MKIVAQSPSAVALLVDLEDGENGRVLDNERKLLFPPMPLESLLARGYWSSYVGPQNLAERMPDLDVLDPEPATP